MMEEKVRVRFAPSPTGHLHIGSVRTALFNWFFARRKGGTYILRIEDTDRERSTEEFIEQIIECHEWLGIDIDEPPSDKPPYRQTDRMELYGRRALELIEKGAAYRCICTPEEVEEMRRRALAEGRPPRYDGRCREREIGEDGGKPFAIRFKTPVEGVTVVDDLLRGPVRFENRQIDDFILIRSNGIPTYNFAAPVDDIDLRVTHVLRGDDHLSNTPKQQMIFNALGAPLPRFGHLSMILGPDKKRLSKRHAATDVLEYKRMGYLPEALINYLLRLGWSLGDKEKFSREEAIKHFSLEHVGSSAAVFNPEKLLWLNGQYMKEAETIRLAKLLMPFLREAGFVRHDLPIDTWAVDALPLVLAFKERAKTLREMAESASYVFAEEIELDEAAAEKFLKPEVAPLFEELMGHLKELTDFSPEDVKSAFEAVLGSHNLKLSALAQPARVALTGKTVSPGIYEVVSLLGREKTLSRIEAALRRIRGDLNRP